MSENISAITSFTFDEIIKDINYDRIFLFVLSYEYNLNFNQIMTLFNFSSDIFWTYINTLRPLLKLGNRKASMLKHTARRIYFSLLGAKEELSEKEIQYYNYLMAFMNDSFSDGDKCVHISAIKEFPLIAYGIFTEFKTGKQLNKICIGNQEELYKYVDSIERIEMSDGAYNKTSRVEFLVEKYYGDLNPREVRRKTSKEIIDMMSKDAIELHSKELEEKSNALIKHRLELVYRNGKEN